VTAGAVTRWTVLLPRFEQRRTQHPATDRFPAHESVTNVEVGATAVELEMTIELAELAAFLAQRAARTRSGRSRLQGLIEGRVLSRREVDGKVGGPRTVFQKGGQPCR
jgi:hypothetical protein